MYEKINKNLPMLLKQLLKAPDYSFMEISRGFINNVLETKEPVSGVYLILDQDEQPLYVGRSKNLSQRLGKDHRSLGKNSANLTKKISIETKVSMNEARDFMYENYSVKFIRIDNVHERYIFEIYAAMMLNTPLNDFTET
jgi:predicted GIY-YIG superfamily endonuclease